MSPLALRRSPGYVRLRGSKRSCGGYRRRTESDPKPTWGAQPPLIAVSHASGRGRSTATYLGASGARRLFDAKPFHHTEPPDRQNCGPHTLAFGLGLARIATMFPACPPTAF